MKFLNEKRNLKNLLIFFFFFKRNNNDFFFKFIRIK